MSASLVGSEMCIRDRWKAGWAEAGPTSKRRVSPIGKSAGLRAATCTCLLYTSDAPTICSV
eukprot:6949080-Alexandrium_andersonii.AAC.1